MVESLASGTARGLIDYLDSLVEKGRSRTGITTPLKTAVTKILERTEGDKWESVDITKIDFDDVMARFKNLTMGDYNEASYQAYESRLRRAAVWYQNFLESPGWYPKERARSVKKAVADENEYGTRAGFNRQVSSGTGSHKVSNISIATSTESPKSDAIAYPFPLENGSTARIFMPKGVTKSDIARLSSFLSALVIAEKG